MASAPLPVAPRVVNDVSLPLSTWPATHSHHWSDWTVPDLLDRKAGESVSVVLPARNEEATVGDVVARLRRDLMESCALVDEIVVIDSDSTDATAAIASEAGARVFASADVRPELGSYPGKGEALWKSQFVTTGDVLVFMDADLVEWDTHFVRGLLGPLLTQRSVKLVKGFYGRPGVRGPEDGGRVTELVARPLIALAWPHLSGVIQPLAGEWAVRRSHLASLRMPTGYAVELAALIDTAAEGIEAIAQVDLGRRSHRHQGIHDLGAMAAEILASADRRRGRVLPARIDLHQFHEDDHQYEMTTRCITAVERRAAEELHGAST